jgi:hypothetical protein
VFIHDDGDTDEEGPKPLPIFLPINANELRRWHRRPEIEDDDEDEEGEEDEEFEDLSPDTDGESDRRLLSHDWIPGQELMNLYIEGAAHNSPLVCITVPASPKKSAHIL